MIYDSTLAKIPSPWISRWLGLTALLIFAMVIVGGATRLTGSGLSITEWNPIMGAIPPLTEADWQALFDKYKLSSQFKLQNSAMAIDAFQTIFWWEWSHRLLGRVVGIVSLLPLVTYLFTKMKPKGLLVSLIAVPLLIALQGALGWYMVVSGLVDRVSVTQYRLAAHLVLAMIAFAFVLWVRVGLGRRRQWTNSLNAYAAMVLLLLVLLQIGAGGLVAGLNAGQGYNTWPTMDGAWIPDGLQAMTPLWANLFENALTVQFDHRAIAYAILILASLHALRAFTLSSMVLVYAILMQVGLGIITLLLHVPTTAALLHQATAVLVLACTVWNLDRQVLTKGNAAEA